MSSNWIFLVGSSRYWFNYRHYSNLLELRRSVALFSGVPINHVVVMNSMSLTRDPRNPQKGFDLLPALSPVAYRESQASVSSLAVGLVNRMDSDENSKVVLVLSGHGGDQFFKFHDSQELSAQTLHQIILEMHKKSKFGSLLVISETCQASSLADSVLLDSNRIPNVTFLSSSRRGQSSYAASPYVHLGVSWIDRFTLSLVRNFYRIKDQKLLEDDLVDIFPPQQLHSTVTLTSTSDDPSPSLTLSHFFSSGSSDIVIPSSLHMRSLSMFHHYQSQHQDHQSQSQSQQSQQGFPNRSSLFGTYWQLVVFYFLLFSLIHLSRSMNRKLFVFLRK